MKSGIHPTYYPQTKIACACGNVLTVGSTMPEIRVEVCSNCHPLYTGKQRIVDTARRVSKFEHRVEAQTGAAQTRKGKRAKQEVRRAKRIAKMTDKETQPKENASETETTQQ